MRDMETEPRNPMGRPPHVPTETTRILVAALASVGAQPGAIAHEIGISRSVLYLRYKDELAEGKVRVTNRIALGIVQRALKGDNACAFFYMKTRAGWSERQTHDITIRNGLASSASDDALAAIALGSRGDADTPEDVQDGLQDLVH